MPEPPASTSEPTPQTSRCWTAGARRSAPSSSRSASGSGSRPRTHSEQPGILLPLETEILQPALTMLRSGQATFHGFGLAQTMREHSGSRSLTAHGTLYKALSRLEEFGLLTSRWEDAASPALPAHRGRSARGRTRPRRNGRRTFLARLLGARMTPERLAELVARWVR